VALLAARTVGEVPNAEGVKYAILLGLSKEIEMTQLELAFSEIEKLPPAERKEFVAWILEELHSEQRWANLFAESSDMLSNLADEALAEHKIKKTKKLDPNAL
jgi:hypothetical protein